MGCEIVANGHRDTVFGKLAGGLLPAPPPVVPVSASDSCSVADSAAVMKRCADCAEVKLMAEFSWLNRATGRKCSYCLPCERIRQKRARVARARDLRRLLKPVSPGGR
jgi:hypothetical protein